MHLGRRNLIKDRPCRPHQPFLDNHSPIKGARWQASWEKHTHRATSASLDNTSSNGVMHHSMAGMVLGVCDETCKWQQCLSRVHLTSVVPGTPRFGIISQSTSKGPIKIPENLRAPGLCWATVQLAEGQAIAVPLRNLRPSNFEKVRQGRIAYYRRLTPGALVTTTSHWQVAKCIWGTGTTCTLG